MPETNYLDEIEREDGQVLTVRDKEARAAIDGMNPTLQQILQGVNDIKNGIGDTKTIIDAILSGEAPIPQVRFLDYDGTVVETYTAKEFATLTELPANPTHEGLTSQGWNWSLADAKTYVAGNGVLDIGQMYVTSDGKTRLYISLPEGRTSPILQLYLNANSELDIDWGDSSTHSTFTSTTANYKSERHEYSSSGDYVIAIAVVSGGFVLQSSSASNVSLILSNGNDSSSSPDLSYNNAIKKIEIGNGVTSIGDKAFQSCYALSSVIIPNSVTNIGQAAFQICYSLSSVIIPDSVRSIADYAFRSCYSLSSITIPDSVTSIDNNAFQSCYSLSSITIPNSVTSIGNYAFNDCYSLSSITIPNSVTSIGQSAFNGCYSLSSVIIPNSVTRINGGAFSGCAYMSFIKFESETPPTVRYSNAWSDVSTSTVIYVPALVSNWYMDSTNYPAKASYKYLGYATYKSGTALPTTTRDERYTLTWYATSADAIAQTNPITQGTGDEVYSRATPVV